MKKLRTLLCMAVILALSLTAWGCSAAGSGAGQSGKALNRVKDIYAFSAVSGAELLGQAGGIVKRLGGVNAYAGEGPVKEDVLEKNVDQINKYLNMFEDMLTGADPIQTVVTVDQTYGEVLYSYKMQVTTTGIDLVKTTYDFYYNEFKMTEDGEDETDVDGEKVEVDEDEMETETHSRIEGVIVMGELNYSVTGERKAETETEDGETESEVSTKFIATDSIGNRIEIEQKVEEEEGEREQSFTYTLKDADGRLVSSDKIDMEAEEGEIEIELETLANEVKTKYKFEREGDKITIKYTDESGARVKATVKVVTDEEGNTSYEYLFVNGNKVSKDRN